MFQKILVPLDGSVRAEQAVPVAAHIARASGGAVILLVVTPLPIKFQADAKRQTLVEGAGLVNTDLDQAQQYLKSARAMPELTGVQVQTEVLIGGVATTILNAIELLRADLVVLCSHGSGGVSRWALGSVAHKIVHHSPVPILLLREGNPLLAHQSVRALVALDGSPLAECALKPTIALMVALAPDERRSLHLLRVVDDPVSSGIIRPGTRFEQEVSRAENRREAYTYLAGMATQLTKDEFATYNLTVTTSVSVHSDVAQALLEKTEQTGEPFDLLAMATHGYGGLQRWGMGSVTERVLHQARLPLLVVHAAAQEE